jgi:hypothetical protein
LEFILADLVHHVALTIRSLPHQLHDLRQLITAAVF